MKYMLLNDYNISIRSIADSDLETLKLLSDNNTFFDDKIWLEQSKICERNGEILGFAVIKQHTLNEYFNGNIPIDNNDNILDKNHVVHYTNYFKDNQYEFLLYLIDDNVDTLDTHNIYTTLIQSIEVDKNNKYIGLLWTTKYLSHNWYSYNFNNIVWLNIPIID